MKRLILTGATALVSWTLSVGAQAKDCRGQIVDEQGEPLIGAMVSVPGTSVGVTTDVDGYFTVNVPDNTKKVKINYVGYAAQELPYNQNLGRIVMKSDTKMLQDVVVTQSKARTRETPIAMSELTAGQIEAKLGNKEFPEVLKMTPGVWATPEGGGYRRSWWCNHKYADAARSRCCYHIFPVYWWYHQYHNQRSRCKAWRICVVWNG